MTDVLTTDITPRPALDEDGIGLSHIGLRVADVDRSATFYARALGFAVSERSTHSGSELAQLLLVMGVPHVTQRIRFMRRQGTTIELFDFGQDVKATEMSKRRISDAGLNGFAFQVKDVDGVAQRIIDAGGAVDEATRSKFGSIDTGYQVVLCRDPDGTIIELIGPQTL